MSEEDPFDIILNETFYGSLQAQLQLPSDDGFCTATLSQPGKALLIIADYKILKTLYRRIIGCFLYNWLAAENL